MFALPLADIIARLAACPALAVLRNQHPSEVALAAVGVQPGSPNETAATESGLHIKRTGGPTALSSQWLDAQSKPCPEAHHPGIGRRALGSPVCTGRTQGGPGDDALFKEPVSPTAQLRLCELSYRQPLHATEPRTRAWQGPTDPAHQRCAPDRPYPRVARSHCRQGMSVTTIPAAIPHPQWRIGASLPRIRLCIC